MFDYTVVKSSWVITLLNCLVKACELMATEMLAAWYKVHHFFHEGQMSSQIQQSAIHAFARIRQRVQQA